MLTARWPSTHGDLPFDPRTLTQTIRQSGLVIAHAEYGVPISHQTLLRTLDFSTEPGFRVSPGLPTDLDVMVTVAERKRTGRSTNSLNMTFRIFREGAAVATAESEFAWISPPAYRRLRGDRLTVDWGTWPLPAPIAPELAGRSTAAEVVLAPGGLPHRWLLRNDISNTTLFDHPVDHVPGLALVEAADQAARAFLAPTPFAPGRVATSYARYVEFDRPCWIEAESLPAPGADRFTVRITGTQDDVQTFRVEFGDLTR